MILKRKKYVFECHVWLGSLEVCQMLCQHSSSSQYLPTRWSLLLGTMWRGKCYTSNPEANDLGDQTGENGITLERLLVNCRLGGGQGGEVFLLSVECFIIPKFTCGSKASVQWKGHRHFHMYASQQTRLIIVWQLSYIFMASLGRV